MDGYGSNRQTIGGNLEILKNFKQRTFQTVLHQNLCIPLSLWMSKKASRLTAY